MGYEEKMEPRYEKLNPYLSHDNKIRTTWATQWSLMQNKKNFKPGLSVVILNLNKPELICPLLESLVGLQRKLLDHQIDLEIIIGDTGSTDPLVKTCYEKFKSHIRLGEGLKYHFSRNNNEMFHRFVSRDLVLFMNNDIVFRSDPSPIIEKMVRRFQERPDIGVIGATLLYDDLKLQHNGIDFFYRGPLRGLSYHPGHREEALGLKDSLGTFWRMPAVTGAFLCMRSQTFEEIGGFDEEYKTECQDVDLCLLARNRGLEVELLLTDQIIHLENATREKGSEDWADRQKFVRQWSAFIEVMFR
jgi:GT2 family glycosyltransferase